MTTLKKGITTGLCAAAAAKAATIYLLSSNPVSTISITARTGDVFTLDVLDNSFYENQATCAIQKYSGDDPDVTNGLRIIASVTKNETRMIMVDGGEGVGRVTKPGLAVPVGNAAINPIPMEMIKTAIRDVCGSYDYIGGIDATISIPKGTDIAKHTMNERLGIVGGLSILGTTGIVEPMSTIAIIETIKTEIDVHVASGKTHLLMTPGNYGKDFAQNVLGLDIDDAIKCSNYIGEALDHALDKDIKRITLIGHAGKLVKLAGGIMNTHSKIADCRMEIIAAHSALAGANADTVGKIMNSVTTEAAIDILEKVGLRDIVWKSIGEKIRFHLDARTKGMVAVHCIVFTEKHGVLVSM